MAMALPRCLLLSLFACAAGKSYLEGPNVDNAASKFCSEDTGSLEWAQGNCNKESRCSAIFSLLCVKDETWRYCFGSIGELRTAGNGDASCTYIVPTQTTTTRTLTVTSTLTTTTVTFFYNSTVVNKTAMGEDYTAESGAMKAIAKMMYEEDVGELVTELENSTLVAKLARLEDLGQQSMLSLGVPGSNLVVEVPSSILLATNNDTVVTVAAFKGEKSLIWDPLIQNAVFVTPPVEIKILDASSTDTMELGTLSEPIVISFLDKPSTELLCGYWNEVEQLWLDDGLTVMNSTDDGRFACATTHLSIFAAIEGSFVRVKWCPVYAGLTTSDASNVVASEWILEPVSILLLILILLTFYLIWASRSKDIAIQDASTWHPKFFLTFDDSLSMGLQGSSYDEIFQEAPGACRDYFHEVVDCFCLDVRHLRTELASIGEEMAINVLQAAALVVAAKETLGLGWVNPRDLPILAKAGKALGLWNKLDQIRKKGFASVLLLTYLYSSPWNIAWTLEVCISCYLNTLLFCASILGALAFSLAELVQTSQLLAVESDSDCPIVEEFFLESCAFGLAAALCGLLPPLLLAQVRSQGFKHIADPEKKNTTARFWLSRWHGEDRAVEVLTILYIIALCFYMVGVLASTSRLSANAWMIRALTILVCRLICFPLCKALCIAALVSYCNRSREDLMSFAIEVIRSEVPRPKTALKEATHFQTRRTRFLQFDIADGRRRLSRVDVENYAVHAVHDLPLRQATAPQMEVPPDELHREQEEKEQEEDQPDQQEEVQQDFPRHDDFVREVQEEIEQLSPPASPSRRVSYVHKEPMSWSLDLSADSEKSYPKCKCGSSLSSRMDSEICLICGRIQTRIPPSKWHRKMPSVTAATAPATLPDLLAAAETAELAAAALPGALDDREDLEMLS